MANHTMDDGNHTDNQSSVKNRAAACLKTSKPNKFNARVMDSPINPIRSVAFMLNLLQWAHLWTEFVQDFHLGIHGMVSIG